MNYPSATKRASSESNPDGMDSGATDHRRMPSEALFCGQREVRIVHAGREYRLFVTRKDKLILTK